jgi:hypothetical protein
LNSQKQSTSWKIIFELMIGNVVISGWKLLCMSN